MTESKRLINEIQTIREQYLQEVGEGKRRVWPRAIRERVLRLFELGELRTKDIAERTKLSYEVISQWKYVAKSARPPQLAESQFHSLPVVAASQSNTPPSRFTKPATVTVPDFIKPDIKVTTPEGYVIDGLSVESAVLVVRGLKGEHDVF